MTPRYDRIGQGYAGYRTPDPRIAAQIDRALGGAKTVVNVGAGTGSYEPTGREVVAVEPSAVMLAQRPDGAAPAVQASAEALPFDDGTFDAAMAVLTVHHWADWRRGVAEMRRVARRAVILTWAPAHAGFWLTQDYFPDLLAVDRAIFPAVDALAEALGGAEVHPVLIPHDCTDGFGSAHWRRPERYLDAGVRSAMSTFSRLENVEPRIAQLASDLEDGTWEKRYGHLRSLDAFDAGYRLIVSPTDDEPEHKKPVITS